MILDVDIDVFIYIMQFDMVSCCIVCDTDMDNSELWMQILVCDIDNKDMSIDTDGDDKDKDG